MKLNKIPWRRKHSNLCHLHLHTYHNTYKFFNFRKRKIIKIDLKNTKNIKINKKFIPPILREKTYASGTEGTFSSFYTCS